MKKTLLLGVFLVFTLFPLLSHASIDTNLKYGSRGLAVTELQEFLINKGFLSTTASGNFFSLTNTAVLKYQASVGLPATGFVGPMTRSKINVDLIATTNTANQQEVVETGSVSTPSVTDKTTQLMNQIKALQAQLTTQTQTQQSIDTSVKQIVQNTTPTSVVQTTPITSALPACATTGHGSVSLANCITLSPTSAQGNQTNTFTFTAPVGYHFGTGSGNTGNEACVNSACIGYGTSGLSESADGSTLTYTTYVKDNIHPYLSLTLASLYDSNNNMVLSTAQKGIGIVNDPNATDWQVTANIATAPSTPLTSSVGVTDTTNGQYLQLPIFAFNLTASTDTIHLHNLAVTVIGSPASGLTTATATAAYLYNGSTQVASASINSSTGVATFSNITDGTAGATVGAGQTVTFTVKADVTGVISKSMTVLGSWTSAGTTLYDSQDNTVTTSGSATGNTITVTD